MGLKYVLLSAIALSLSLAGCATVYSSEKILKNRVMFCKKKDAEQVDVSSGLASQYKKTNMQPEEHKKEIEPIKLEGVAVYSESPGSSEGRLNLDSHECEFAEVNDNAYELHGIKEWEFENSVR